MKEDEGATRNVHDNGDAILTMCVRACSYSITQTHPIYKRLKKDYDLPPKTRKWRRSSKHGGDMISDIFGEDTEEIIVGEESV